MLLFLISAVRAVIEMLGLCLLGQGVLKLLAGRKSQENPIYCLFALITRPPLRVVARMLPNWAPAWISGSLLFLVLFLIWSGLAVWRKFL